MLIDILIGWFVLPIGILVLVTILFFAVIGLLRITGILTVCPNCGSPTHFERGYGRRECPRCGWRIKAL
jgi:anaerobic ribonucleoside-triphosphate reductase